MQLVYKISIALICLPIMAAEKKTDVKPSESKAVTAALAEKSEAAFIVRLLSLGGSERQNPDIIKKAISFPLGMSSENVIHNGHTLKVAAPISWPDMSGGLLFKTYFITDFDSQAQLMVSITKKMIACHALGVL